MKITILIPCHNEEKSIRSCIQSCLDQTRPPDQVLVVNDGSTDNSGKILKSFGNKIDIVTILKATGNKSHAQEYGLAYIEGDIFIATDGDTILNSKLVEIAERVFIEKPWVVAICGCVKSLKHNWLTAYRETEYTIGQALFKVAQSYIDAIFVIPGCSGAFNTKVFKKNIHFDHDTLTEDLDFTYKFHELGFHIAYEERMIAYTQDPDTLNSYINQMRRWYSRGWQNMRKHFNVLKKINNIFQLSISYTEGLIFSLLVIIAPIVNIRFFEYFIGPFLMFIVLIGAIAGLIRKRFDLFFYSPLYIVVVYINVYLFLEQFWIEIIKRKSNLVWFQPKRREISI